MNGWHINLLTLPQQPDLTLPTEGVTVLFGQSGCGKTRLLRALAGLDPHRGNISFRQQRWLSGTQTLAPAARKLGMMFQESRLLPHKTVADNIVLGQSIPLPAQLIDALDLTHLLHTRANQLSGGEQRRVALARALAHQGQAILLDEPLTGLDAERKRNALALIKAAGKQKPVIMVTHQLDELLHVADHLMLMDKTRLCEGQLQALINHPLLVQQRGHAFSILCGEVKPSANGFSTLLLDDGQQIRLVGKQHITERGIAIDARDVSIALTHANDSSILNIVKVRIHSLGDANAPYATLELALGRQTLRALLSGHSIRQLGLAPGQWVYAQIKGTVQI